ncbi:hypothetical protein PPYR_12197 [Photinus pyralis]|uniref:Uncharacterized protein n=2 Tax=Photinus pyralis TaxID=7054 RepID=A0A5N4ADP6_PHOPY|nr:hypothetical protein PPYR_12197 [Photinus pyralis]
MYVTVPVGKWEKFALVSQVLKFAICLLIIFIIELAVGIAAAVFKGDFETALRNTLESSMKNYNNNGSAKNSWDTLHTKLKCCGIDKSEDWKSVPLAVPSSCCKDKSKAPVCEYYEKGCLLTLQAKVKDHATVLIGVGIGIAFVQVLGIALSCLLAASIKSERVKN